MSQQEVTASKESAPARRFRLPFHDVDSSPQGYELRVFMPGVSKDGVKVSLEGRRLEIEGHRNDHPQPSWRPVLRELNWDDYRLHLDLNVEVDEANVAAEVKDGVLRLSLPKAEEAKPRRIEVA